MPTSIGLSYCNSLRYIYILTNNDTTINYYLPIMTYIETFSYFN